jgi:hypothetical protein
MHFLMKNEAPMGEYQVVQQRNKEVKTSKDIFADAMANRSEMTWGSF